VFGGGGLALEACNQNLTWAIHTGVSETLYFTQPALVINLSKGRCQHDEIECPNTEDSDQLIDIFQIASRYLGV
jgi:hypothetical protein